MRQTGLDHCSGEIGYFALMVYLAKSGTKGIEIIVKIFGLIDSGWV